MRNADVNLCLDVLPAGGHFAGLVAHGLTSEENRIEILRELRLEWLVIRGLIRKNQSEVRFFQLHSRFDAIVRAMKHVLHMSIGQLNIRKGK